MAKRKSAADADSSDQLSAVSDQLQPVGEPEVQTAAPEDTPAEAGRRAEAHPTRTRMSGEQARTLLRQQRREKRLRERGY